MSQALVPPARRSLCPLYGGAINKRLRQNDNAGDSGEGCSPRSALNLYLARRDASSRHARTHVHRRIKGSRSMQKPALTQERAQAYWQRTSTLMWTILAIWFFFSFVIHFFAVQLNSIVIF